MDNTPGAPHQGNPTPHPPTPHPPTPHPPTPHPVPPVHPVPAVNAVPTVPTVPLGASPAVPGTPVPYPPPSTPPTLPGSPSPNAPPHGAPTYPGQPYVPPYCAAPYVPAPYVSAPNGPVPSSGVPYNAAPFGVGPYVPHVPPSPGPVGPQPNGAAPYGAPPCMPVPFVPGPYGVAPMGVGPNGMVPGVVAPYGPTPYGGPTNAMPPAPPPVPPPVADPAHDDETQPAPLQLHTHPHHVDSRYHDPHHHAPHHARRHHPQLLIFTLSTVLCTVMVTLSLVLVWHDTESFDRSAPVVANGSPDGSSDSSGDSSAGGKSGTSGSGDRHRPGHRAAYREGGLGIDTSKFLPSGDDADDENRATTGASSSTTTATSSHNPFETDEPVAPHGTIDTLVLSKLESLRIPPAHPCTDEVFLRRIYVDVLGVLPTADEARKFLDDPEPQKRVKLVDHALERPEFADYWAMKWSDHLRVKAEFPIKLWPNAAQAYHHWIRAAIHENMPYDQFARELLTSSGSNFRTPPVNFYRAVQNKEPKGLAAAVALTFLGERAESWPAERLDGMAVFFSQIGYKPTGEWKEEIVYFDRRKGKSKIDESLTATLPNGVTVPIRPGEDPRQVFANWLLEPDNPWFARVVANRIWCWLLGRGIVDPPDDIRRDNPPANRELLGYLAAELIKAKYDLKHLYRLILNSETYQLGCIPEGDVEQSVKYAAAYPVRRLDAEILIDGICQITGTSESYMSIIPEPYTFLPEGQRAVTLPDGSITSSFLEMFGRPPRDTGLESERTNRLTAAQALHLLNSNHLRNKLKQGTAVKELIHKAANPDATAESLYLTILSRRPTDDERALASGLCGSEEGALDLAWALINSDEFLFRH